MPAHVLSNAALRAKWMRQAAETLRLEIEAVEASSAGLDRMLAGYEQDDDARNSGSRGRRIARLRGGERDDSR